MIDFSPVRSRERSLQDLAEGLTREDLVRLTNEMWDDFRGRIAASEDADVPFVPVDVEANDTFAADPADVNLPWTLGHVIVHATASSEEAAAHALTLARGLEVSGRSRYEVPWQGVTGAAFIRERIEESRRMQLAMIDAWPTEPHLDATYTMREGAKPLNAIGRFLGGLMHADSHREQVTKVLTQAQSARQ